MADEQAGQTEQKPVESQGNVQASAATENIDTAQSEHMIPKSRFDEVNKRLKELETAKTKAEQAAAKAEEDRLAKQQEWAELASKRQERIAELEPRAELAGRLTELIAEQINEEIKGWPAEVKAMAPSGEVSPVVMLEWVKNARPLAQKLQGADSPPPGSSRGPKPRGAVRENREVTPVVDVKRLF